MIFKAVFEIVLRTECIQCVLLEQGCKSWSAYGSNLFLHGIKINLKCSLTSVEFVYPEITVTLHEILRKTKDRRDRSSRTDMSRIPNYSLFLKI